MTRFDKNKKHIDRRNTSIHKINSRLIINADDFGITKGVNRAISELAEAGIVTSTSVMSNMPLYNEILDIRDKIGIAVHFNLTVGKPITRPERVRTLVDEQGNFLDLPELLRRMKQGMLSKREIEIELTAQIEQLKNIEIYPDHIDSHESLLKYPFLMKLIKKVAKSYEITAVRTYSPRRFDYTRLLSPRKTIISLYLAYQKFGWKSDGFSVTDKYDSLNEFGLNYDMAYKKLEDIFKYLPTGILEVGVHPGYCNGDDTPLGGYVKEREAELQALSSREFKEIIENSGAELISYNDI